MPTDRVVEYDNAGIPKLFSIERLHRKLDVEGLFGHGIYGIFATPRDEAMRIFAESDLIVLTVPTTDRQYPFPINSKIKECWDDVWQQTNGSQIDLLDGNPRDSIPRVRATSPESRIRFGRHH